MARKVKGPKLGTIKKGLRTVRKAPIKMVDSAVSPDVKARSGKAAKSGKVRDLDAFERVKEVSWEILNGIVCPATGIPEIWMCDIFECDVGLYLDAEKKKAEAQKRKIVSGISERWGVDPDLVERQWRKPVCVLALLAMSKAKMVKV